jgi:hypothetical protein
MNNSNNYNKINSYVIENIIIEFKTLKAKMVNSKLKKINFQKIVLKGKKHKDRYNWTNC